MIFVVNRPSDKHPVLEGDSHIERADFSESPWSPEDSFG